MREITGKTSHQDTRLTVLNDRKIMMQLIVEILIEWKEIEGWFLQIRVTKHINKLANYCSLSKKSSINNWNIKTIYKIDRDINNRENKNPNFTTNIHNNRAQSHSNLNGNFTQKHASIKHKRDDKREKDRRKSRHIRNEEQRK